MGLEARLYRLKSLEDWSTDTFFPCNGLRVASQKLSTAKKIDIRSRRGKADYWVRSLTVDVH